MTRAEYNKIAAFLELFISSEVPFAPVPEQGKVPSGKTWSPITKGRMPKWVTDMTGIDDRQVIRVAYGPTVRFVEGAPLPPKI
jgi:hypothetical protein